MEAQIFLLYMLVLCANVVVSYPQPLKEEQENDIFQPLGFLDSKRFLHPSALLNSQGLPIQLGNAPVEWLNSQESSPQLKNQPVEWSNSQTSKSQVKYPPVASLNYQGLYPRVENLPVEWSNSQNSPSKVKNAPIAWLNFQALSPQLDKLPAESSNSQKSPAQIKNPSVEWLNSQRSPTQVKNPSVEWLNFQGFSPQLGNPSAQWLYSHRLTPQNQSNGLFQISPQYQPLEMINTQKQPQQPQFYNYNTPNNGLRGFKENLQEQSPIDQPKPEHQQNPVLAKPEIVTNNYQGLQFIVPDTQKLAEQYGNELAGSSNVHNDLQNYGESKAQRPFTPIINNDLGYQQYLRPSVPPMPVSNFENSDQPKPVLNQLSHLTTSNPGNMQVPVTSYKSMPPEEPQYIIEPIVRADPSFAPVNKTAALDTEFYNPILQNSTSQTAPEKDHSTSHYKRYIVVHRNETVELIDNLNDIIVDDFNIAHIKTKDGLNPIMAVIEVEDSMKKTEDEKPSNLPYDTGLSNIPETGNWNTNYHNVPDLPQNPVIKRAAEDTDMKYFSPEYIMPIESSTQYNENLDTTNDVERVTKTDINYLNPEYVMPLQSTTENSIDNSTNMELLTSEYNGNIHNKNADVVETGDVDINKYKSEYFIPTEPTTTNIVRSTYTAQLISEDNNLDAGKGVDSPPAYIMPTESLTKYSYYGANSTTEKALKSTLNREYIDIDPYTTQKIEYSDKNDNKRKYVMSREFAIRENNNKSATDTPKYIGNTDYGNGREFYYGPEITTTNTIPPVYKGLTLLSSTPPPLVETNGQSTTIVNLSNDPATTPHSTFAYGMKYNPETESLDDNKPINHAYRKLKEEYGIDATSDLKPEIGKSYIWFRPDENFINELLNEENPHKTVVIYDVDCQPKVIERYTTVNHFPNGTEVIDYVETIWDKPGDSNPREVKTHRMVMNLDD